MSDDADTTSGPAHRADAPVDGGAPYGEAEHHAREPHSDHESESSSTDTVSTGAPEDDSEHREHHSIADLGTTESRPFDQTNGLVDGIQGDSDYDEEVTEGEADPDAGTGTV